MAEKKYVIHRVKEEERYAVGKELAQGLRKVDGREMELAGVEPVKGCVDSLVMSPDVWAAREKKDGRLIAVWGIREVVPEDMPMGEQAVKRTKEIPDGWIAEQISELARGRLVWCLGTNRIAAHRLAFAMESKRILMKWARKYGVLWNYVATFNRDALSWLAWCGAEFYEIPAWQGHKERFVRFEIRAEKKEG